MLLHGWGLIMPIEQTDLTFGLNELVIAVGVPITIVLMLMLIAFFLVRAEFEKVKGNTTQIETTADAQKVINQSFTGTQAQVNALNSTILKMKDEIHEEKILRLKIEATNRERDKQVKELLDTIKKRDETIAKRDATIAKLELEISEMQDERAKLIKQRDELNKKILELNKQIKTLNQQTHIVLP